MLPPLVQDEPLYSSVSVLESLLGCNFPQQTKAAVCGPPPANCLLAVLRLFCSAQLVPLYSSVSPVTVVKEPPPEAKAAV